MTTFQSSNRTINAAQRWQASGLAAAAPLKDRLAMLTEIMLRTDLTQTEQRLCYYLLAVRTNADDGLCFASDQNLADALGVTKRAIEKSKQSLKAKNVLDWNTERLNRKNTVSLYRFIYRERPNTRTVLIANAETVLNRPLPNAGSVSTANASSVSKHYAAFGSAELAAWDRWSQITKGKSLPRDRAGGWHVDQQWPPQIQMTLADLLAT